MQYVQYPIIAALLVVLLVLYQAYRSGQRKLMAFDSKVERLQRKVAETEKDMRKMSDTVEGVGRDVVKLKHGLTSVSNQIVGMREQQAEREPASTYDTESSI